MADYNTINTQAVYGFVDFLESAAEREDPRLKTYWEIIIDIQDDIYRPKTKIIRRFQEFKIPHGFQQFGKNAYDWLVFHVGCRSTETALGTIGHTRPGLKQALMAGLATHEKSSNRRTTREDPPNSQVFPGHSKSMAEFYATEGALKSLHHQAPEAGTTDDIPQTRKVQAVKKTSKGVFEHISWRLMDTAVLMQEGEPAVLPWSTSFHRRDYPTFKARWKDMVLFLRKSKAGVANLLISPYWNRFAGDPDQELKTKKINKKGNGKKNAKLRGVGGDQAVAAGPAENDHEHDDDSPNDGSEDTGTRHGDIEKHSTVNAPTVTSRQAEAASRQTSKIRERQRRQRPLSREWQRRLDEAIRRREAKRNHAVEAAIPQPAPNPQQGIVHPQVQGTNDPEVSHLESQQGRHTGMEGGIENATSSEAEQRDRDGSTFTPNQIGVRGP